MAKKQGSDQHHQGKVLKYVGSHAAGFNGYTYRIQFEDGNKENVFAGDIQVRTKW